MYITVNDIIGEQRIDLSYPIHPTAGRGEAREDIAVVSMLSNNAQTLLQGSIEVLLETGKKVVLNKGIYTDKDLNSLTGPEMKSQMLDSCNDVLRANKLEKVKKLTISINELDNSNNLEDGAPSNTLFTYYVTDNSKDVTRFEPVTPQYKKLKSGMITSLTLKIMDQANSIMANGPGTTVVLHIK